MSYNWGVMITRAQPFHKGHMSVVKKMLKQNDRALVIIGSADKFYTTRNPFKVDIRTTIVYNALDTLPYEDRNRVHVMIISDWIGEENTEHLKEWGSYLYYNIVANINQKTFTMYYNDAYDIKTNWFNEEIGKRIEVVTSCSFEDREEISATKVRKALKDNDIDYLQRVLIMDTHDIIKLRNLYINILHNYIIGDKKI